MSLTAFIMVRAVIEADDAHGPDTLKRVLESNIGALTGALREERYSVEIVKMLDVFGNPVEPETSDEERSQ